MGQAEVFCFLKKKRKFLCVLELAKAMKKSKNSISKQMKGLVKTKMVKMKLKKISLNKWCGKRNVRFYKVVK